ncbi:MAG: DUF1131 family protein [Phormidesmis sp.]
MTLFRQTALMCGLVLAIAATSCTPTVETEPGTVGSKGTTQEKISSKKTAIVSEAANPEAANPETAASEEIAATADNNSAVVEKENNISTENDTPATENTVTTSAPTTVRAVSNNIQPSAIQVTDSGIGSLTPSTPFSLEAVQSAFPNMNVTTTTQSAEGTNYTVLVVSEGNSEMMKIEPTGDESLIYRVKVTDTQFSGNSGHTIGDTFAEVYGGTIPNSCVSGIDEASGFVLCTAPSSQNVQYAFTGDWAYTFDQLPADAALSSGVLQQIVWLPGNF